MKKVFAVFIIIFLINSFFLFSVFSVSAESKFITGLKATGETGAGYGKVDNPMDYMAKIVGSSLTPMFIGVTFLIVMLYAGVIWMIARGNEQEVEKAKNIIIAAIIGLAVVLAAYAASWYIINVLGTTALKEAVTPK